jgi:hypothetical protein
MERQRRAVRAVRDHGGIPELARHPRRGLGPVARGHGFPGEVRDHGVLALPFGLHVEARGAEVPLRLRRANGHCGRERGLDRFFDGRVREVLGSEPRTLAFDARAWTQVDRACGRDVRSGASAFHCPRNERRGPGNELRSPANERMAPLPFEGALANERMARAPFRMVAAPFARSCDLFARSPVPWPRSPAPFAMVRVNERRVRAPFRMVAAPFGRSRDLFAHSPLPWLRSPAPFAMVFVNERRGPSLLPRSPAPKRRDPAPRRNSRALRETSRPREVREPSPQARSAHLELPDTRTCCASDASPESVSSQPTELEVRI